jgi:hypothetical protein
MLNHVKVEFSAAAKVNRGMYKAMGEQVPALSLFSKR